MAERVAGTCRRNQEYDVARGSDLVYDDLGLSCVPVPLERDRKTIGVAGVKFNEHEPLPSVVCLRSPSEGIVTRPV